MITVRFIKNWQGLNIMRQSPGGLGIWDEIKFTTDPIDKCDYVITSNYSSQKARIFTFPDNVWSLQQEPPNEYFRFWHQANQVYSRVFTTDSTLQGSRFIHCPPALPWHIEKTYDELLNCSLPEKVRKLSFITSNKKSFVGQKKRIKFLNNISQGLNFDLFGFGINPINDKWDGLAPYRYSLIIENYSGPYYWSEKLADCFLAWTMPIYYGCTNLTDYFPKDSFIQIDIKAQDAINYIQKIIDSDLWIKRRKALEYARRLILQKYQFFPFFSTEIKKWEKKKKRRTERELLIIPDENKWYKYAMNKIKRTFFIR